MGGYVKKSWLPQSTTVLMHCDSITHGHFQHGKRAVRAIFQIYGMLKDARVSSKIVEVSKSSLRNMGQGSTEVIETLCSKPVRLYSFIRKVSFFFKASLKDKLPPQLMHELSC